MNNQADVLISVSRTPEGKYVVAFKDQISLANGTVKALEVLCKRKEGDTEFFCMLVQIAGCMMMGMDGNHTFRNVLGEVNNAITMDELDENTPQEWDPQTWGVPFAAPVLKLLKEENE